MTKFINLLIQHKENGAPGEIRTPDHLVRSQDRHCNLLIEKV